MLYQNPMLSMLNLNDLHIGDYGVQSLVQGMSAHKQLVSLNISSNNVSHDSIPCLYDYLVSVDNMVELKMANNPDIGN